MDLSEFKKVVRSDSLPSLRDFFSSVEAQLGNIAGQERYDFLRVRQLQLVVDANVLLADVAYLAAKPKQKELRTRLQELIANETVVAFAPPSVSREVSRHLPDLARQKKLAKTRLMAVWREYKKLIVFKAPKAVEDPRIDRLWARDADDVPVAQLMLTLKAHAVLTSDKDHSETGLPRASAFDLLIDLQAYARNKTVEMSIYMGGYFVVRLSIDGLVIAAKLLSAAWRAFRGLPPWAQWAIIIGAAQLVMKQLATPERRDRLLANVERAADFLLEVVGPIAETAEESRTASLSSWDRVQARLAPTS